MKLSYLYNMYSLIYHLQRLAPKTMSSRTTPIFAFDLETVTLTNGTIIPVAVH